jgi:hypothetical protein
MTQAITVWVQYGLDYQERPDLHPRFRLVNAETVLAPAEPARNEDIPRQFLPVGGPGTVVTADKVDDLVKSISKQQVPGIHQKLRVDWYNPKGEVILTGTWPVRFSVSNHVAKM